MALKYFTEYMKSESNKRKYACVCIYNNGLVTIVVTKRMAKNRKSRVLKAILNSVLYTSVRS